MTKYICKFCNKEIEDMCSEIGIHATKHTKRLELPSKALRYYRIVDQ